MKSSLLIKSAAVVAILGAAASAHASLGYVPGDLILGFQNGSKSVEFSIGGSGTTDLPILTADNGVTTDFGNISAGLSSTGSVSGFGSTWNTDGTVSWGVAVVPVAGGSLFITGMQQTGNAPLNTLSLGAAVQNSTPVIPSDASIAAGSLNSLTGVSGMNSVAPSTKIMVGGVQVAATEANTSAAAWNKVNPNLATQGAFGAYLNSSLLNTQTVATTLGTAGVLSGLNYSALDLYEASGVSGAVQNQFLGTLALTTGGEVFFTSAIPEPSTYAMILGAAALGFVMLRRRQQVLA
jgi:hypothetical protein